MLPGTVVGSGIGGILKFEVIKEWSCSNTVEKSLTEIEKFRKKSSNKCTS